MNTDYCLYLIFEFNLIELFSILKQEYIFIMFDYITGKKIYCKLLIQFGYKYNISYNSWAIMVLKLLFGFKNAASHHLENKKSLI